MVILNQRYFLKLSYQGTEYCGWQSQLNSQSIQETIESALSVALQKEVKIVGCGRTDAGVHASEYYAHMDVDPLLPEDLKYRLNQILPRDIAIQHVFEVPGEAHARFDAVERSYVYQIHAEKNPFIKHSSFYYPQMKKMKFSGLQKSASLLLEYEDFYPFCKTKSDVKNYRCNIYKSEWEVIEDEGIWKYHITANRFLRGMVRLIVGMSINFASGKIALEELKESMKNQNRLQRNWSVPPQGLFLSEIKYDGFLD